MSGNGRNWVTTLHCFYLALMCPEEDGHHRAQGLPGWYLPQRYRMPEFITLGGKKLRNRQKKKKNAIILGNKVIMTLYWVHGDPPYLSTLPITQIPHLSPLNFLPSSSNFAFSLCLEPISFFYPHSLSSGHQIRPCLSPCLTSRSSPTPNLKPMPWAALRFFL